MRSLRSSVVQSLLAHALFCALCLVLIRHKVASPPASPIWVEVIPSSKAHKNDTQPRVVQSNVGREEKTAAPDAFLGEKTRVVDRQTVNTNKAIQSGMATNPAKSLTKADRQERSQPKGQETGAKSALSKFGLAILPETRRKGASEELNKDAPQWANIGAQPQDYVQGIKESDRTALNTREYLYFGYHQRIRQRLELEWTRLLRETLIRFYRNGRHLANDMEYSTRLLVILNERGEITRIKVLDMSGTQELDDVAVQAFNKAGPFPNPPKGLVRNGEVEVPWELKLRS